MSKVLVYNKRQTDALLNLKLNSQEYATKINEIDNKLSELESTTVSNAQSIAGNSSSISNINDKLVTKANDSEVVKLNGTQTISGNKTFGSKVEITADNEILKLKNNPNTSNYIAGYEGNTRIYLIGKISSTSKDLTIKNENPSKGFIVLATQTKFDQAFDISDDTQVTHKKYVDESIVSKTGDLSSLTTANKTTLVNSINEINSASAKLNANNEFSGNNSFSNTTTFGEKINFSSNALKITPKSNVAGEVHLSDPSVGSNCRLDLNLDNVSKIKGTPDPTEPDEVANKKYVDARTGGIIPFGEDPMNVLQDGQVGFLEVR